MGASSTRSVRDRLAAVPYPIVCAGLGLLFGWLPWLVHGPHPSKFAVLYIHGQIAVWAFYTSRLMIGLFVGITAWPRPWYLRGPLCGFLVMLPVALIALATPPCPSR
jgi:hypothetical protein